MAVDRAGASGVLDGYFLATSVRRSADLVEPGNRIRAAEKRVERRIRRRRILKQASLGPYRADADHVSHLVKNYCAESAGVLQIGDVGFVEAHRADDGKAAITAKTPAGGPKNLTDAIDRLDRREYE